MSEKTSGSKVRSAVNRRRIVCNRIVAAMVLAVVVFFGWQAVAPHVANSATDANVVSYTVRPGDTLWSYARQITPADKNVGDTVAEIMDLNQLDSAALQPGQRIMVPEES